MAEEDWRLFEADKKGLSQSPSDDPEDFDAPDWGAPGLPEEDVDEEDVPMSSDNLPHLFKKRATGAAASSSEGPVQPPLVSGYQHLGNRWYKRTRKAKADEFVESLSPHIVDLVKVMTAAHREGHGDIVWLAYEAARRGDDNRYHRDDRPNFGSQLIGISRAGALSLQEEWYRMRLGHFDLSLKHVLVNKEGVRTSIRSCFAYPSVGHYMTKESGVMLNPVDRVAAWDEKWVQEGTRKETRDDVHRGLYLFATPLRDCTLLRAVPLPEEGDEDLQWLTLWVPGSDAPEPVAGASGASSSTEPPSQETMRRALRREVVQATSTATPLTKRQQRQRRAHLRDYGRRIFTTENTKASWVVNGAGPFLTHALKGMWFPG